MTPVLAIVCIASLAGCSNMNDTQQRTLSGTGIGAGVGMGAAALTGGCVSCGAAIGAAAGAGSGYLYDRYQKNDGR
jgi:osmotically inducible lipoprotein OsmB